MVDTPGSHTTSVTLRRLCSCFTASCTTSVPIYTEDDDNNSLSGSSNDGSQIDLDLRTYPGYDGQDTNTTGYNEIQVLEEWMLDGFGFGELQIEIEVETSSSPIPGQNDNEEEVNIIVEIVTFKAIATN